MRRETGFTLIELVLVTAIAALITLGAGMSVVLMKKGVVQSKEQQTVIRQPQNAAHWIALDALMAKTITIGDDPDTGELEFFTVYWKNWETADTHEIAYIWLDSADSLQKLKRNEVVRDKDGVITEDISTLVADNIYSANLTSGPPWVLTIEARAGAESATRTYKLDKRSQI